jgi:alkylation response protein AidB-like acyl-CoA dehydrogenase
VLSAWVLRHGQNEALKAQWLPRIAAAETVLAVAIDESARPGEGALKTTAKPQGDGYALTGHKQLVIDGHAAETLLVAAQDPADAAGVLWLWVPRDAQGVTTERVAMADAHLTARVQFIDVAVPADAVIASGQAGAQLLASLRDVGRLMTAAELIGVGDEAFARTLEYLKQRKQFGKLIGEFQALQHRAAELYCDMELARAMVWAGLQAMDEQAADAPVRVAQAKARASLSANRAALEGVQMHGGMGMTDELDMGLLLKRARALQALFGDAHQMLDRMAQLKGY